MEEEDGLWTVEGRVQVQPGAKARTRREDSGGFTLGRKTPQKALQGRPGRTSGRDFSPISSLCGGLCEMLALASPLPSQNGRRPRARGLQEQQGSLGRTEGTTTPGSGGPTDVRRVLLSALGDL